MKKKQSFLIEFNRSKNKDKTAVTFTKRVITNQRVDSGASEPNKARQLNHGCQGARALPPTPQKPNFSMKYHYQSPCPKETHFLNG